MKDKDIEEMEKIKKGNTNKLLIIFFLILFILLFSVVIVLNQVNIKLEEQLDELEALSVKTEQEINDIKNDVNSKIENAIENIVKSEIENTVTNDKSVYESLELRFSNFTYRREKGESAGFFIKDKLVFSGIENDKNTHAKTEGIEGTPKYIIPIDKQLGKTIVLTEEGKAFINTTENGAFYGTKFKAFLENYKFIEIIELGEVYKLYLVTDDARVFDIETGKEFVD